jgi:hypothetical protein
MSVSVDGFIADRESAFGWSARSEELFRVVAASAQHAMRAPISPPVARRARPPSWRMRDDSGGTTLPLTDDVPDFPA